MMKIRIIDKSSYYADIRVQYKKLDIDTWPDSSFFYYYLEKEKQHLSKSELIAVYVSRCFNRIMEMNISEEFKFYYDFSDQYSEGIRVQRESTDSFSIHRIITGWGALNPHSIDGNQTLDYKLQGTAISENRSEFLIGLLRSVEGLLIEE